MAADPKDARTKRRKAMGDDPNKMAISPQPMPGLPQDQKGGNVMNNPMNAGSFGPQTGSFGGNQYMYGEQVDGETQMKLGAVGVAPNSGFNQNIVPGQGRNSVFAYNTTPGPTKSEEMMMEPQYEIAQAQGATMPNGAQKLFGGGPPPYQITPMGPTGAPATPAPGALPTELQYSMPDDLPMQGQGMSMDRGGGRNRGKN